MLYSKTAHMAGGSGFFFDDDENAPADAVTVKDDDVNIAINLPVGASFDFDSDGVMTVTPAPIPSAAEVRAKAAGEAWGAIKAERDRRKAGGVMIGGKWFHTDDPSRIQYGILDSKATRASLPATVVLHPAWKTMSSEKTPMTVAVLRQILDAGIVYEGAVFDVAETHRAAMEASADPAAYDFSGGWPMVFGE